jgi:hypothetical protein
MRQSIFLLSSIFFFALPPSSWSDTLWDRAVRHFSRSSNLPATAIIDEDFISATGKVEYRTIIDASLFRTGDDRILFVPHTGYANGENIPKDELTRMSEELSENDLKATPFDKDTRIHWQPEQDIRVIAGRSCQRFSFAGKIDTHQAEGSAWLARDSGLPLLVEWAFTDVPFKQADTTIRAFHQKNMYGISSSGQCNLLSSEVAVSLEYMIFSTPYKGRLLRKTSFANHRNRHNLPADAVADN